MTAETERNPKNMHLTSTDVKGLFIGYLVAMTFGLYKVISTIVEGVPANTSSNTGILDCVCMSMVGSSIYYVRKLYKASINDTYTFTGEGSSSVPKNVGLQRVGTLAFFIFRPVFGVAFAVVVYSLWRLSLSASGGHDIKLTEGFMYTTVSLGFISGFLAGRLLTMLEGYGTRRLNGMIGTDA